MVNKKIALQAIGEQNSTFLCSKSILGKCEDFVKLNPHFFLIKSCELWSLGTTRQQHLSC
jgi:hypothetical protein